MSTIWYLCVFQIAWAIGSTIQLLAELIFLRTFYVFHLFTLSLVWFSVIKFNPMWPEFVQKYIKKGGK